MVETTSAGFCASLLTQARAMTISSMHAVRSRRNVSGAWPLACGHLPKLREPGTGLAYPCRVDTLLHYVGILLFACCLFDTWLDLLGGQLRLCPKENVGSTSALMDHLLEDQQDKTRALFGLVLVFIRIFSYSRGHRPQVSVYQLSRIIGEYVYSCRRNAPTRDQEQCSR